MLGRPPRSTRSYTPFPDTTRVLAGGHAVADADAARARRARPPAPRRPALYRSPDRSDHGRRHRQLCHARGYPDQRTQGADRLCGPARDREHDPRKAPRRLPALRISARPRHDRHGRPSQGPDRDARPPDRLSGARDGGVSFPASSLRGAKRRGNPELHKPALDCFAPLAMTSYYSVRPPCPSTPIAPTPPSRPSSTVLPPCRRAATSSVSNASPNCATDSAIRRTACPAPSTSRAPTARVRPAPISARPSKRRGAASTPPPLETAPCREKMWEYGSISVGAIS